MNGVYFNEFDDYPAEWLQNLFPTAVVDRRSVKDVRAVDTTEYLRCHFFAGIGGWEYALQLANWPADREVWTGSCPCQPFSQAGKRKGVDDNRHLWPEFFRLIKERRPATIFGEQVASADGRAWLAGVFADLEGVGYAVAGADMCGASVGAPHIRQRLYWVADRYDEGPQGRHKLTVKCGNEQFVRTAGLVNGLADMRGERFEEQRLLVQPRQSRQSVPEARGSGEADGMGDGSFGDTFGSKLGKNARSQKSTRRSDLSSGLADTDILESSNGNIQRSGRFVQPAEDSTASGVSDSDGISARAGSVEGGSGLVAPIKIGESSAGSGWMDWGDIAIMCADGKARRVEPGILPLAHGISNRVGQIRAYGNAIIPQVAAKFVTAFLTRGEAQP